MTEPSTLNGTTSIDLDLQNASGVEAAPPRGPYDVMIVAADVRRSTKTGSEKVVYIKTQYQIETEPARGRTVFDMHLLTFKDGAAMGTPGAYAHAVYGPNLGIAISTVLKLDPALIQKAIPATQESEPITLDAWIGKRFRGNFGVEFDEERQEKNLKLRKVLGPPTGEAFVPKARKRAAEQTGEEAPF